ncbi:twin-arginine translocase subunit TatC [Ningiella sp. W23]|uniref:twin-arginine translocase subunit TatC n=1 Tax=Ningiella sp. W23 TaxID=3023715 RepID=UPI0037568030
MRKEEQAPKTPLLNHLLELRSRLLRCLLVFVCALGISFYFAESIYSFLQQPLLVTFGENSERRMIYTGLHEAFFTYLKLAFFSATFITLPLILIQIWKFIAPGLYQDERRHLSPVFLLTPILFLCGAALAFFVVMPLAWDFFISFESFQGETAIDVQLEAKVSEYLSLVIQLILAFGLCFELPILLFVLCKSGVTTVERLAYYRRHAIVGVFLIAALITPPDLISQIALGLPVILLYELSLLFIRISEKNTKGKVAAKTIDTL